MTQTFLLPTPEFVVRNARTGRVVQIDGPALTSTQAMGIAAAMTADLSNPDVFVAQPADEVVPVTNPVAPEPTARTRRLFRPRSF